MRKLASSVVGYVYAMGLYSGQQVAKRAGLPKEHVNPKNRPAPGPDSPCSRSRSP